MDARGTRSRTLNHRAQAHPGTEYRSTGRGAPARPPEQLLPALDNLTRSPRTDKPRSSERSQVAFKQRVADLARAEAVGALARMEISAHLSAGGRVSDRLVVPRGVGELSPNEWCASR